MVDYIYPTIASSWVIASGNGKRTHVYGMLRKGEKILRCPPTRFYRVTQGGTLLDNWPITTSCKCSIGTTVSCLHPVLDDNSGVRVYGLNILNSTQDYIDFNTVPIAFMIKTSRGYNIGADKAVTFLSDSSSQSMAYMWAMPATIQSSPVMTGTMNTTIGTRLRVFNSTGYVDSGYNTRIASPDGRLSFLRMASGAYTTSLIPNRTEVAVMPTVWAVVSCGYCTPVSISTASLKTSHDPYAQTSYYPTLTYNTDTGYCMLQSNNNKVDISGSVGTLDVQPVRQIYSAGGHGIYFVWQPLMGGQIKTLGSSSNFYTYLPPAIKCEVDTSAPEGSTIFCRIIQYGMEFNL